MERIMNAADVLDDLWQDLEERNPEERLRAGVCVIASVEEGIAEVVFIPGVPKTWPRFTERGLSKWTIIQDRIQELGLDFGRQRVDGVEGWAVFPARIAS